MKNLDRKMIFEEDTIKKIVTEFFGNARLASIDDFEFTIEVKDHIGNHPFSLDNIPEKMMQVCSLNFWAEDRFLIHEYKIEKRLNELKDYQPLMIDCFLVASSSHEISVEIQIRQGNDNLLFSSIIKSGYQLSSVRTN